jgi:putative endonuclease
MEKVPCVYILASERHGTLYIGVTSDLCSRVRDHKLGEVAGFTKRYNIKMLVWFELCGNMEQAIQREKQLKEWQRGWKITLIEKMNPMWLDLYDDQCGKFIP